MTEISSHVAIESPTVGLRRLAVSLGQTGLMEWDDVEVFLNKERDDIAPLLGSVAALFVVNVKGGAKELGTIEPGVANPVPKGDEAALTSPMPSGSGANSKSEAVLEALEPLYRAGREACPKEFPLSGGARRFLTGFLEPYSTEFWPRLDMNGLQAVAFGETMIADYTHSSQYLKKVFGAQSEAVRMYLAGHSDEQILEATNLASVQAIRGFRLRLKRVLLENYTDGRQTARRRFARCLTMKQFEVLKAEFPGAFKDKT